MSEQANTIECFFALIRCGIGKEKSLPCSPTPAQWAELFDISRKQTLAGIAFAGIEALPSSQRPPKEILLKWYSHCESIKKSNQRQNRNTALVSQKFREEGFDNCILKGQGIAALYPDPSLRTPGDIDIWLDGGHRRVLPYIKRLIPDCAPTYHHVDFPIADGLDIEVHYRPTWLYTPFRNKKLQSYFSREARNQFTNITETQEGNFPAPTTSFNRIYILLHIYRHIFGEGVGLRQILDYHFVMQQEMSRDEEKEYIALLKRFGIYRFAGAVTHVTKRVLALDDSHSVIAPDKKSGEFLMKEIMLAGNFGKYDTRYKHAGNGYNFTRVINLIKRYHILITRYPSEVLWAPVFKIWHYFWRKCH